MIIIGLTGPIGHGKTVFAEIIKHLEKNAFHIESSDLVSEVADVWQANLLVSPEPNDIDSINETLKLLPQIIRGKLNTPATFEQLAVTQKLIESHPEQFEKLFTYFGELAGNHSLAETHITNANKETYRTLLQWIGGYLVLKVDPGIWYNEIIRQVKATTKIGKKIAIVGGLRYPNDAKIIREAGGVIVKIQRPNMGEEFLTDLTERDRNSIKADCVIVNNGSLADLKKCAATFLVDLHNQNLQPEYIAV